MEGLRGWHDIFEFFISHRGGYRCGGVILTHSRVTGEIPTDACVDYLENWYENIPSTAVGPCRLLVDSVTGVVSFGVPTTMVGIIISSSSSSSNFTSYRFSGGCSSAMSILTMRNRCVKT